MLAWAPWHYTYSANNNITQCIHITHYTYLFAPLFACERNEKRTHKRAKAISLIIIYCRTAAEFINEISFYVFLWSISVQCIAIWPFPCISIFSGDRFAHKRRYQNYNRKNNPPTYPSHWDIYLCEVEKLNSVKSNRIDARNTHDLWTIEFNWIGSMFMMTCVSFLFQFQFQLNNITEKR